MQNCDQVEDYKINNIVMPYSSSVALQSQVESKEGRACFLLVLIFCRIVLTNILCLFIEEKTC